MLPSRNTQVRNTTPGPGLARLNTVRTELSLSSPDRGPGRALLGGYGGGAPPPTGREGTLFRVHSPPGINVRPTEARG